MKQTNIIRHISLITLATAGGIFNVTATPQVAIERIQSPSQLEAPLIYQFNNVPRISGIDLANGLTPVIVGTPDPVSGAATKLTDGLGASNSDDPAQNFFFFDPTSGPYNIFFDLGGAKNIAQVNSYSWHHGNGVRASQDYDLFASTGTAVGFNPSNLGSPGWQFLTSVDTELSGGDAVNAGQHGASVSDTTGALGSFRYVALSVRPPTGYGQTFYSEIDIVAVPEPSVLGMLVIGCIGMAGLRRPKI